MRKQQTGQILHTKIYSPHQRRTSPFILHVDVCAVLQQRLYHAQYFRHVSSVNFLIVCVWKCKEGLASCRVSLYATGKHQRGWSAVDRGRWGLQMLGQQMFQGRDSGWFRTPIRIGSGVNEDEGGFGVAVCQCVNQLAVEGVSQCVGVCAVLGEYGGMRCICICYRCQQVTSFRCFQSRFLSARIMQTLSDLRVGSTFGRAVPAWEKTGWRY